MYSIMLAAMLTAGTATPEWGWGHGCGWYGYGYGYGYPGWYGGGWGYPGYWGGGYYGWPYYGYGYPGYGYYGYGYASNAQPSATDAVAAKPVKATVVVAMPEDAKLFVEGQPLQVDPKSGSFVTPPLEPGSKYVYTVKVEVVRDGKKVTESKDISLSAGEISRIDFKLPATGVARGKN